MKERWIGSVGPPPLARAELAPIVAAVLPGVSLEELRPLTGGFRNHNFAVPGAVGRRVSGGPGGACLLRVYAPADRTVFKEQRIAELVRGVLRTPQYLRVEQVGERWVALRSFEAGRPLHEVLLDPDRATFALGVELGGLLARLHAFRFERHAELGEQLELVHPFELSAVGLLDYVRGLLAGASGERLGRELSSGVLALWQAHAHALEPWLEPPRLIHGDFGPTNLISCEDGTLSVIDWEFACSNSPAFDLGNLLRPPLESSAALQQGLSAGYERAGGRLPERWQALARFADTLAWLQFLARPECAPMVLADACGRIAATLETFRDGGGPSS